MLTTDESKQAKEGKVRFVSTSQPTNQPTNQLL
jgi:hypothetical protein